MVFCNIIKPFLKIKGLIVTILILIDGFLQFGLIFSNKKEKKGHNPYFNRWFSAISYTDNL